MRARAFALLALAAVPLSIVGAPAVPALASPSRAVAAFPATDDAERQLFELLNGERAARSLQSLARVPLLDTAARNWSQFMTTGGCVTRENRRLCHRTDLATIANQAAPNGWVRAGENVGLVPDGGTIQALHDAFVASPAHLANIAQKDYNAVGVGVRYDPSGTLFVTYEFLATMGKPNPVSGDPAAGLPALPPGLGAADSLLFYINDARAKAGLKPLTRNVVLDREANAWSVALATKVCGGSTMLCHRPDLSIVTRAAVGAGNSTWWSENVGLRQPAGIATQFSGFMASAGHRANIMRPNINLVGIGYVVDGGGRAFTTLEFVAAKKPSDTLPPGGNPCGWIPVTQAGGAKGPYIRVAQCALAARGYPAGGDGKFSAAMVAAVKGFQAANHLKVNGRLDLATRRALGVV
jgi:uncharacterized protein YkwD